jgi:hypothetical protein
MSDGLHPNAGAAEARRLIARAYRAPDAAEACRRNAEACARVLRTYGIENITSAGAGWWDDPDTHAVLLEDADTGEPRGGVRLQRWRGCRPLPLERALQRADPRVHAWVAERAAEGLGEVCGLWCGPEVRGFGLGARLTLMGIALATAAGTRTLLGVCDTRNVEANVSLGFERDTTLASRGSFEYPRPGLVAHVLRVDDAHRLQSASPASRALVCQYRDRPVGEERLRAGERDLILGWDLRLPRRARDEGRPATRADCGLDGGAL